MKQGDAFRIADAGTAAGVGSVTIKVPNEGPIEGRDQDWHYTCGLCGARPVLTAALRAAGEDPDDFRWERVGAELYVVY